jgi:hypothetical protein
MDEQQFLNWLASLPGKTTQQKLNYMQDVLGTVGVDLFGAKQEPFVPDVAPVNQIEAVWGTDPGMAAVMDFIRVDKMSPKEAVDEARTQGLIPRFDPNNKGEIDYMGLASDFASEEASRPQWEAQQAQNQVKYEAGLKPTLDNMFQSPYERMGSPTVDDLLGLYGGAADRQRFMSKGSNASKVTWETPVQKPVEGKSPGVTDIARAAAGMIGNKASKWMGFAPVPYSLRPAFAAQTQNAVSGWAPTTTAKPAPVMKIVEDKAKWARDEQQAMLRTSYEGLLRRNLENRIELNKRGRVATPQGEKVMRNLSILGLLNG